MLPNILTISRIFSIPFIIACFYINDFWARVTALILFILACITDFLDGYFARQWRQVSSFGKFLDPVADKLLVTSIIIMLCSFQIIHQFHTIAALIIVTREISISALREFAISMQLHLHVTKYAKIKTTVQMLAILVLLSSALFPMILFIKRLGIILLWGSAFLTVITGIKYFKICTQHMCKREGKEADLKGVEGKEKSENGNN